MKKKKKANKKNKFVIAVSGLILIAIVTVGFFLSSKLNQDNGSNAENKETEVSTTTEEMRGGLDSLEPGDAIIAKVKKLIILPEEEDAILIVIRNAQELKKQQAFYRFAEDDDYLVVLPISRIAIIYNARKNILASVGPIEGDLSDLFGTGTTTSQQEDVSESNQ